MQYIDYKEIYGLTEEEYEELDEIIAQQDKADWEEYMRQEQRVKYTLDEQWKRIGGSQGPPHKEGRK